VTGSDVQAAMSTGAPTGRLVSDRLIGIIAGTMFALGVISLGFMATEPCGGDFMCPAMGLVFFGPPVLAYLAALVIWLAAHRIMPLLVLSVAAGLFGFSLLFGGYVSTIAMPLLGFPFLAPLVVIGSVEVLRARRIERWLSVGGLGALAVGMLVLESPAGAIATGLIAAAIAVLTRPSAGRSSERTD
jgi:hypothetical protein